MRPLGNVDVAENVEPDPTLAFIGKDSFVIIVIPLCAVFLNDDSCSVMRALVKKT